MTLVLDRPLASDVDPEWWQSAEYLEMVYALEPNPDALHVGRTEPRLGTEPLRPLTRQTSLGFEVIEFAEGILKVTLYPWQRALLIRALELRADGVYRFRRIIVLVARQQGKTTLASVLAAWWLFVESARRPDRVPPMKFKIVGVAQTLDIAKEPWSVVKLWCDPEPDTEEEGDLAIPALQDTTAAVRDVNGGLGIFARSRAHYEIRAAKNARGKPAARILMDEMREQKDWAGWNAVSQTVKSFWNGQLFGFSNAGDTDAVVLRQQREAALADLADWAEYVTAGLVSAEQYANENDVSLCLLEWSAPEGCAKNDVEGILAANPSIGYGAMTVASALADIRAMTDAGYRTEVLCQWVTSRVESFIDPKEWNPLRLAERPAIPHGGRTVWAVDTAHDRGMTWIGAAVLAQSGHPFVTSLHRSAGMLWAPEYLEKLADESGSREVVLQGTGAPSMEFAELLEKRGLHVHALNGGQFAIATGRMRDAVRQGRLLLLEQPDIDIAVQGGVVTKYAENLAWSRRLSLPIDIAGLVAMTEALYGLEVLEAPKPVYVPPPPAPAVTLARRDGAERSDEANLKTVQF